MTGLWATLELVETRPFARLELRARSTRRAAHLLVMQCAIELGVPSRECRITYDDLGAPSLRNGLRVSLAHSGNVIAAAVGEASCGIDIEPRPENDRVTRRALAAAAVMLGPAPVEAIKRWVVLEAFAKFTGRGLAPLLDENERAALFLSDEIPVGRWHSATDSLHNGLLRGYEATVRVDIKLRRVSALAVAGDPGRWRELCIRDDQLKALSPAHLSHQNNDEKAVI